MNIIEESKMFQDLRDKLGNAKAMITLLERENAEYLEAAGADAVWSIRRIKELEDIIGNAKAVLGADDD